MMMNRSGSLLLLPVFLEAYRVAVVHHPLPLFSIETDGPLSVSSLARIHVVRIVCSCFDVAVLIKIFLLFSLSISVDDRSRGNHCKSIDLACGD